MRALDCPFCGSVFVEVLSQPLYAVRQYHVVCDRCHAHGPQTRDRWVAVARWNERRGQRGPAAFVGGDPTAQSA